jgi:DNA-binding NtrC family response regulator
LNLPTLVVCDSSAEKQKEIEGLVTSQPDLAYIANVSRAQASEEIASKEARLVWIELDPDPPAGTALLGQLKEKHPKTYFLVSYQTLNADLVKTSMHLGAIDYLDAATWQDQLPDVVTRLVAKEKSEQEAAKKKLEAQAKALELGSTTADRLPAYKPAINKMRKTMDENDGSGGITGPVPLPNWVLPTIILVILAMIIAAYVVK